MDSPDSDRLQLFNTLEIFPKINRWLTPCHRLLKHHVLDEIRKDPQRSWRLIDLGAGGGDMARWLIDRTRVCGIQLTITCLDHDPRVVDYAREKCDSHPEIEIRHADVGSIFNTKETWDFAFANHFLHHLSDIEILSLLKSMVPRTRVRFIFSDIHRTWFNYFGYSSLLPLRATNSFVWHDGRLSIRRGFTREDWRRLIHESGVQDSVVVQKCLPGHLVMIGRGCQA